MELQTQSREELIALLTQALETIQSLQAQVAALQEENARLKNQPPPPPASDMPAFVKPNVKKKVSQKRKPRKHAFVRRRQAPTQVVTHAPQSCSGCGRKLAGGWLHRVREVIELPQMPVEVIHHHVMARYCGVCNRREVAELDLSEAVVGQSRLGVRLMSVIAYLDTVCRMPVRLIQRFLSGLYGLCLSVGEIVEVLHRVAKQGETLYEDLKKQVQKSQVAHADETSWREDGQNGYIWSFSTPSVRWFSGQEGRSGEVAKSVLGTHFGGVLVSDFYSAYHWYRGPHQYCWVHLLRDIHKLCEQHPKDAQVALFAAKVKAVYEQAKAYSHPNGFVRGRQRRQFQKDLEAIAHQHEGEERPERVLAQRILKRLWGLFVFVEYEDVPSDNNAAERAIRPLVVVRKVSGGSRSSAGSTTVATLLSLFGTWQVREVDLLEECRQMLLGNREPAPA